MAFGGITRDGHRYLTTYSPNPEDIHSALGAFCDGDVRSPAMTSLQQTPQGPDLVLVMGLTASGLSLATAIFRLLWRQHAAALRLVKRWAIGALIYVTISLATSIVTPAIVLGICDRWCFDDWCVSVDQVIRTPVSPDVVYNVHLRLFNAARRAPQAVRSEWAYVRDGLDHRYLPQADDWKRTFERRLQPGESAQTVLAFRVPANAHELGFVTGHGGTPCALVPSLLIIGQGRCLFQKPNMIRID
jgi:hypothetical protein